MHNYYYPNIKVLNNTTKREKICHLDFVYACISGAFCTKLGQN